MPKPLPSKYFTSPRLFGREIELFFGQGWVWVGRAEAIAEPGSYFLRDVAGESVIVLLESPGSVRAFYNVCRHRGTRICAAAEGNLGPRMQCPYHGWTYGLDGRLLAAPHMPAKFSRDEYPLHPVKTAVWDGHVFVNLAKRATALERHLGTLPGKFAAWKMQDLRVHERIVYEARANWKLIVLNYSECLHCPLVHPALNRLTDYLGADNEPPTTSYLGGAMAFAPGVETMSASGRRRHDYLPGLSPEQRAKVYYYAILPNLLLSLHPDYVLLHSLWPQAVDHTRIICEWYFHPNEISRPVFDASDAVEFWDTTNREDWRVVELSQLGIASRAYRPGPYSEHEELLYAFDQLVLHAHARKSTPRARR